MGCGWGERHEIRTYIKEMMGYDGGEPTRERSTPRSEGAGEMIEQ